MKKNKIISGILTAAVLMGGYLFNTATATHDLLADAVAPFEINGYEVGDAAADFSLKSVSGQMVSLADFPQAKGFIIVFTCNHCPFSKAYEERVIALNAKYSAMDYPVIAINPNDPAAYEEDSYENMQKRAAEKNYTFPYLEDNKMVGYAYGASRTPHVFVLKKEGGKNMVKYVGAIDDNAQDASAVSKRYVEDAVNNLLGNKPVIIQTTKAIGCAIKWRE